jgi:hypothetical protein
VGSVEEVSRTGVAGGDRLPDEGHLERAQPARGQGVARDVLVRGSIDRCTRSVDFVQRITEKMNATESTEVADRL